VTPQPAAPHPESPSLRPGDERAVAAYEMKFRISEARAGEVEAWAAAHLDPDPHGDPQLGGAYQTTTLYLDTPELHVYYRQPSFKRRKYRVRRYGSAPLLFLERKSKSKDRVKKRRTALPGEDLDLLANPMSLVDWPGHWFHTRLLDRRLAPACRVAYLRTAFVGSCPEGLLRLTLDRQLRGVLAREWDLTSPEGGLPLLAGEVVLELKFTAALPLPFKGLVREMKLDPGPVSKYRLCHEAWGLPSGREVADA
jgi:hypothetical protein